LIEPTSGRILLGGEDASGRDLTELRRGIGYVIQQVGLFPHQTIGENVATVPRLLGWSASRRRERAEELLELVGLNPARYRDRYPSQLSGGERQRVGVARALAADPPILLMDEPYSAVDPIVRGRLQDELLALQAEVRKTIVLVTHDIDEAIKLGDQIAVLNVGGVLEQAAPPEEMLRAPANEFVADFLGQERGLKRLGLLTVDEAELVEGPVVPADADADAARQVMAEHKVDWVGVVDRERLLGWVSAANLNGTTMGEAELRPFAATVSPDAALREALDVIVGAQTRVAVVEDADDRYLGMLTIEQIAGGLEA
ncbi:MAG TPA: ABC transporter ATP-binding protein, partial [Acidimicrobiales bacterium]|nr:ABC transporter ATP-binding protein [Acidimicrobiales bacterium]